MMSNLSSDTCPIGRYCINNYLVKGLSLYCEHFEGFFPINSDYFSFNSFYCKKDERYKEISKLEPDDCPNGKESCLGCEKIIRVEAKPYPEKSHCYIVCG